MRKAVRAVRPRFERPAVTQAGQGARSVVESVHRVMAQAGADGGQATAAGAVGAGDHLCGGLALADPRQDVSLHFAFPLPDTPPRFAAPRVPMIACQAINGETMVPMTDELIVSG